jgi:hypothetical protein
VSDLLASGLKSLHADLAALPKDAKAALILQADLHTGAIVVGTAANLGKGWVLSLEAEFALKTKPTGSFAIGKVWR